MTQNFTEWTAGTIALAKRLLEEGAVLVGIATLHLREGVSDEIDALLKSRIARKGPGGRLLLRRNRRDVLEEVLRQNSAAQSSGD